MTPFRTLSFAPLLAALLLSPFARPQAAAPLTPRQKAALQKACAAGTLTPEECAAKGLGSNNGSSAAAPAGPGHPYKDPSGRYSLVIPDGWNSVNNNGDLSLTSGKSWVQVLASTADSPSAAANTLANNFHSAFSTFNILNHGASTIAGHDAWGMNFDATSAKSGEKVSVLFISQSAGNNHYLTLVSCTPIGQAPAFNDIVMQIANSVQF